MTEQSKLHLADDRGAIGDAASPAAIPLCIDLDGTLLRSDLLYEAAFRLIKARPVMVFFIIAWLLRGKVHLKRRIAEETGIDYALLPYRSDLLDFIRQERAAGRSVHLVTASPQRWADGVAAHLGVFASATGTADRNQAGTAKADALIDRFGEGRFDYIGDHRVDIPVWQRCRVPHFAGHHGGRLARRLSAHPDTRQFNHGGGSQLLALLKAARPHQWSKNLLLFVSLAAAHELGNMAALLAVAAGVVAFSLTASATYMINDLLDLDADRAHPRKRSRPFASGAVDLRLAIATIAMLMAASIAIAYAIGIGFLIMLAAYVVLTLTYSLRAKRASIADVILLASLYTLRILAGTIAGGILISSWLLAFSMFCFITLAVAKRCAELSSTQVGADGKVNGRGYYGGDIDVLAGMGAGSSFSASLVVCIYTTQPYVVGRYASPELLWLICPLLLYALNRIVLMARRGHMHDDPIVFCAKDRITLIVGALAVGIGMAAALIDLPFDLIADV